MLVPQFLDAVPVDPFDGKPLRYRIDADKIVIWSIHENMTDDGGVLVKPEGKKGATPDIGFRLLNTEMRGPIPIKAETENP